MEATKVDVSTFDPKTDTRAFSSRWKTYYDHAGEGYIVRYSVDKKGRRELVSVTQHRSVTYDFEAGTHGMYVTDRGRASRPGVRGPRGLTRRGRREDATALTRNKSVRRVFRRG